MYMLEKYYDEITAGLDDPGEIVPIDITGAARWAESGGVDSYDTLGDFPIVVPPAKFTWMEYEPSRQVREREKELNPNLYMGDSQRRGCFCLCVKIKPEEREDAILSGMLEKFAVYAHGIVPWLNQLSKAPRMTEARVAVNQAASKAGRDVYWMCAWASSIFTAKSFFVAPMDVAFLDSDGRIVTENYWTISDKPRSISNRNPLSQVLFATSLMHAKNVELVDNPLPPKVAKRRQKDGKPVVTFKTLKIESMRKQAMNAREGGDTSAKRALHLVRGHFKDYREGGGLFGKYNGLYWWDMHVAGNEKAGIVVKDYSV